MAWLRWIFDTSSTSRFVVLSKDHQEKAAKTGMTSVDENTMASFLLDILPLAILERSQFL
jgi:hypothetical protein